MRESIVLVLLAGCYDPSPLAGSPCSPVGTCPETLVCTDGYCVLPGVGADAAADAPIDGTPNDALVMVDTPIDAPMLGWSAPMALAGVNTASVETDPSFTANGLELYFSSNRAGGAGNSDIWYTKRASVGAAWDAPTNVAALNSAQAEASVEISPDGMRIYFSSSRTGAGDIYTSTKGGIGWTPPVVVTGFDTAAAEGDIAVSPDELTAIVARGAAGARTLSIATRATTSAAFGPLTPISDINSAATDPASPSVTNDAAVIYFHADNPRNIYVATKIGAGWSAPIAVTEVNTQTRDAAPFVTQSNDRMMFERDSQLYETTR